MNEIASVDGSVCTSVALKRCIVRARGSRASDAATRPATKTTVPGMAMKFRFTIASSGVGCGTTGGTFSTAGGKASPSVARAVLGDAPRYNQLTGESLPNGDVQLSYVGYPAINYALDRAFKLAPPIGWVGQQTNTMSISGVILFTNTPIPGTNNFWHVRSVP